MLSTSKNWNDCVEYRKTSQNVNWQAVSDLFQSVDWDYRAAADLEEASAFSACQCFAFFGEDLVGFGHAVEDGENRMHILDLVVAPDFQGRGIGSRILAELRDALATSFSVRLTPAAGKEGFYAKQGWLPKDSAYIWPRS